MSLLLVLKGRKKSYTKQVGLAVSRSYNIYHNTYACLNGLTIPRMTYTIPPGDYLITEKKLRLLL
jgi:hypothetical protein